MPASSRDSGAIHRPELLRSARELIARARHARLNSRRLIQDAEQLIPPVLCRCGTPLYSVSAAIARLCPSCSAKPGL
jgi:hypothetical protein